jgi:peptidoglycan/xylan/chitin deacetylase (PgdA/CDA1 family)
MERDRVSFSRTMNSTSRFRYSREQERESIRKTVAALEKVLGQKPVGYSSPGQALKPRTLELVAEAGFVWCGDPLNSEY